MKVGYLAHFLMSDELILKNNIALIEQPDNFLGFVKFEDECANTLFFNGILLIMNSSFDVIANSFWQEIKTISTANPDNTLFEIIAENTFYLAHKSKKDSRCSIYQIDYLDLINWKLLTDTVFRKIL